MGVYRSPAIGDMLPLLPQMPDKHLPDDENSEFPAAATRADAVRRALDRLRRDPGLPVPTLVAHGRPAADHANVAHPTEGR